MIGWRAGIRDSLGATATATARSRACNAEARRRGGRGDARRKATERRATDDLNTVESLGGKVLSRSTHLPFVVRSCRGGRAATEGAQRLAAAFAAERDGVSNHLPSGSIHALGRSLSDSPSLRSVGRSATRLRFARSVAQRLAFASLGRSLSDRLDRGLTTNGRGCERSSALAAPVRTT